MTSTVFISAAPKDELAEELEKTVNFRTITVTIATPAVNPTLRPIICPVASPSSELPVSVVVVAVTHTPPNKVPIEQVQVSFTAS